MQYTFVALAIAFFGQALANPIVGSEIESTVPSSFPVSDLTFGDVHTGTTLSQGGLHTDSAQQEFPASLFLCRADNCVSCTSFDLSTAPFNECLTPNPIFSFVSAAIVQPSNEGLPFETTVGTTGCGQLLQLPEVNECFNLNGGVFETFALLT
ncbi:hypothetical protein GY45DRAFT_1318162 [Cubamyces sp. BRFM 1775]|nr:hypothetical protein GY45DRAFT_1318162 [Cubamyces sp. BRFM 1775]